MKYRFIAMLDILGFKNLLERTGIREIHQLMADLFISARKGSARDFTATISGTTYRRPLVRLNYFIFSDTILVWKDFEDALENQEQIEGRCEPFMEFNHGISMIMENALLRRIPLRGGIAFGKTIIIIDRDGRNNEIIGQPIVDAYLVGEAQDWVGVAFHSSCLPFIEHDCDHRVIEFDNIPYYKKRLKLISNGSETKFSLEWGGQQKVKEILEEIFTELKENHASKKILKKYRKAIDFCKDHEVII